MAGGQLAVSMETSYGVTSTLTGDFWWNDPAHSS